MPENLITRALLALTDAKVRFVVCGGVACILHGVARATHDLDVRVALEDGNLSGLVQVAHALGLRPRIPEPIEALLDAKRRRAWVEEKHAVVYTLQSPSGAFAIDVFLVYPIPFEELAAEADTFRVDGRDVLVSSKRHLIEAKRAVHPPRKLDLRDIEDLLDLIDE
ncbi:MAG: hypothetical protein EXR71_12840 [Myxococcales bacterium]|nr:hypothetical protein [Myxococcales bacterium]